MLLLGIDAGSSSVKVSIIDAATGKCLTSAFSPGKEMEIITLVPGWAEQDPEMWWTNLKSAIKKCVKILGKRKNDIGAIGISYQMHGLVLIDSRKKILRPTIIWCDSRAVNYGEGALKSIGKEFCLSHLLNSPGNFTAAKLAWVKENEPSLYEKIYKVMFPGDYLAMRFTGEIATTFSGLSEGIFWDFKEDKISDELLSYFGFDRSLLPEPVPSFSLQGRLLARTADELGLPAGIPISYRGGDQPNNALSLNVLLPGELAATAGTSGVLCGITDQKKYDSLSRVNTFLHVNNEKDRPRLTVLMCINGAGMLNSWIRRISGGLISYNEMNDQAAGIRPGCNGLTIMPFGNGAERMLLNRNPGCRILGLNFNLHTNAHLFRAAQESIAFSFRYGIGILRETGFNSKVIRAGAANMFLSPVFREALSCITGTEIHLYNTDGSMGAARGAGIGCGYYSSMDEAFRGLDSVSVTTPDTSGSEAYYDVYQRWLNNLSEI